METLKKLLEGECNYRMKNETMDRFLSLMTEIRLKRNQILIDYGEFNNNVYLVKSGIVRLAYFDGFKEMTFGFGLPGTLLISYYPFVDDQPSFTKYEACCNSTVMKMTKIQLTDLANQSHDFAQWMMYMSLSQLLFHERKLQIVNGDARERFESLITNRPEIIEKVSSRIIASYIGITESYLSTLKQEFADRLKKK